MDEHWFGRRPPEGTKVAWGCRAIFSKPSYEIDIVPTNQQAFGTIEDRRALQKWINTTGLPALRKKVKGLDTRGRDVVSFESKGYRIEASPQASAGYLYVGAWPVAKKASAKKPAAGKRGGAKKPRKSNGAAGRKPNTAGPKVPKPVKVVSRKKRSSRSGGVAHNWYDLSVQIPDAKSPLGVSFITVTTDGGMGSPTLPSDVTDGKLRQSILSTVRAYADQHGFRG